MQSIDILYMTLSVAVALMSIFISVTLIYLMFILRDIVKVTDQIKELVANVNTYIAKPILLTKSIIEFVAPFVRGAEERIRGKKK
ncbi:MAG: hypothetical protein WC846_03080 [Candidatus Gracilibacteria bacterium]|jgi:hypothetical protein